MKAILYATDYSQNSIAALKMAYLIAKKFEAKLIVMHVFDIPISLASPVSMTYLKKEKRLLIEHTTKLKRFCEEQLSNILDEGMTTLPVHEDGSVHDGILEKAFELNVDLIVVGTKGTSQIKELILGSIPKALIKKSSFPILAVPEKAVVTSIKNIVYATDFEQADIFAIKRLVKIAEIFNAEIIVVHITSQKEYAGPDQMEWFKEMVQEKVTYKNLKFELIISDTIFEALVQYLVDSNAHLLVMLERKESTFYQRYLETDMVKKMVKNTNVPLLSYSVGGL